MGDEKGNAREEALEVREQDGDRQAPEVVCKVLGKVHGEAGALAQAESGLKFLQGVSLGIQALDPYQK